MEKSYDNPRTIAQVKEWADLMPSGASFTPSRAAELIQAMHGAGPSGRAGQTVSVILVRDCGWKRARLLSKP